MKPESTDGTHGRTAPSVVSVDFHDTAGYARMAVNDAEGVGFPDRVRRRRVRVAVCASLVALLLSGPWAWIRLFTPPPAEVDLPAIDSETTSRIFVVVWSYHSSLVISQPAGWRLGPEGAEDAPFVEYGWGDRAFYMESNYWPHALFASAFLPTESVVYLRGLEAPPPDLVPGVECYASEVTGEELRRLLSVLEQAMARPPGGPRPAAFPPVDGYAGRFYPGREYYIFWQNCNEWTVRVLKEAGLGGEPAVVLLSGQVGGGLEGFERLGPH